MIVKWSNDPELILKTITHKDVYKCVSDDRCPSEDNFSIPEFSDQFFCAECHDDQYLGCFCFIMKSENEAEIHTCLLPQAKGLGVKLGGLVLDLVSKKDGINLVSTYVPEDNQAALSVALKCGFKFDKEIDPMIRDGKKIKTSRYIFEIGDLCQ